MNVLVPWAFPITCSQTQISVGIILALVFNKDVLLDARIEYIDRLGIRLVQYVSSVLSQNSDLNGREHLKL